MSEAQEQDRQPLSLAERFWGGLWALVALPIVFTFWQQPYLLTLMSAFRFQMLVVLVVLSVPPVLVFSGRRRLLFVAVPCMVAFTFLSYLPIGGAPPGESSVSVAVVNVFSGNRDLTRVQSWLQEHPADILGVLEVSSWHEEQLRQMGFEHAILEPRTGNFGLALLSREAPIRSELIGADTPFPALLAEFESYRVLLMHPPPPIRGELRRMGDSQVETLMEYLKQDTKPTIVMGDFNATGWDLRVLPLKESGFKDARQGHGLLPTWPADNVVLRIPIDHIFVPQEWTVSECETGPEIGSDHFPLRAVITPGAL